MKLLLISYSIIAMCMVSQGIKAQNWTDKKVLIVYLSRANNTKAIAEIIHQQVGGTLVVLELQNPYPTNYQAIVAQVGKEDETGFLPKLKNNTNKQK